MNAMFFSMFAAAAPLAVAQEQATTLAAACDRSDVVVLATVTAVADPSPAWHRLVWRTDEVLAGQIGATLTLLEPAGACCGRSLFALGLGDRRLLFLRRAGQTLHPFGGSRGVVVPTAGILAHARALLAAPAPAARAALLAASLGHAEPRVALDAAHALAAMPALELGPPALRRVRDALTLAVRRGLTSAAPLLDVTVRTADPALLDTALALYLEEPRRGSARLLRRGLARAEPALLTGRLPAHLRGDPAAELRAAELLRAMPGHHGEAALSALLASTDCPRVQLCAAEGLLAAGRPARALRASVPAAVLELAERRVAAVRFRSIRPDSR